MTRLEIIEHLQNVSAVIIVNHDNLGNHFPPYISLQIGEENYKTWKFSPQELGEFLYHYGEFCLFTFPSYTFYSIRLKDKYRKSSLRREQIRDKNETLKLIL